MWEINLKNLCVIGWLYNNFKSSVADRDQVIFLLEQLWQVPLFDFDIFLLAL